MSRVAASMFALALSGALRAAAQSGDYAAHAQAQAERLVASHGEDPTASGTALHVQDRVAVPLSLGEVLREAPGAQVRSIGGLGAYSSVSLRGSDAEEALVLLDEIPLVGADGGAFDLSAFPAELFERVDVFRGGAPVWLGSGAIGGVVRLVPRRSDFVPYDAAVSGGSFGTWQAQAGESAGHAGQLQLHSRAIVRSAQNDYPYDDDRGTRFDPSDDIELHRKNAQLTDASGYLDLTAPLLGGQLHALLLANGRVAGEPGPGSQPTPDIRRAHVRSLAGLGYERRHGLRNRLQLTASMSYAHDRYTDLYGELGVSRRWNTRDHAYRGFVRAADTLRILRWLEATLLASYALDRYAGTDDFTFPKPVPSTRHEVAGAFELAARAAVSGVSFELRPSLRLDWSRTELHSNRGLSGTFDADHQVLAPTARLGAGVSPLRGLAFTGSIATGTRLPTMFELFGDRGLVLPAPALEPVTSTTYDAGVTLCRSGRALQGSLELRGFIQKRHNEIGSYRTAQYQIAHVNLSDVEQRGFELGLQAAVFSLLRLHGAATYMKTEDAIGKRLPLRPVWNVSARPELHARLHSTIASSASAALELNYRSFVFADRANLAVIAPCTTAALSVSLGFMRDRLHLVGRITDLTDARCTDYVGYPLPGRALLFTLTYQELTDDHA